MGRNLLRNPKRTLREFTASGGARFRVVAYRIPPPAYKGDGCGPKPVDSAHPDDVLEGLFAAVLENQMFAATLEELAPGTPEQVALDAKYEIGVNGPGGAVLSVLMGEAHREGLLPMLLRATELRDSTSAALFVAAWRDEAARERMRKAAERLLSVRDCEGDAALAKEFRAFGLPVKHKPRVGKDGKPVQEQVSAARTTLRYLIAGTSRLGGYG